MAFMKMLSDYKSVMARKKGHMCMYEGWNFNSGSYLFTTDTK